METALAVDLAVDLYNKLCLGPTGLAGPEQGDSSGRYLVGWREYVLWGKDSWTDEMLWHVVHRRMYGIGPNQGKLSGTPT